MDILQLLATKPMKVALSSALSCLHSGGVGGGVGAR